MKKLIPLSAAFLFACMMFSSCSSNFEITKRRYTKGYFIDRGSNKDMTYVAVEKIKMPETATSLTHTGVLTEPAITANSSINSIGNVSGATIMTSLKKAGHITPPRTSFKEQPGTSVNACAHVIGVSSLISVAKSGYDDNSRREGLSLFWLVILVILILWAIGLLAGGFGLGWIINILLVIALILLILWLLRLV